MSLQLRKQGSKAVQLFEELIQLVGMALESLHSQISLCKSSAFSAMSYGVSLMKLQNLKVKLQAGPSYLQSDTRSISHLWPTHRVAGPPMARAQDMAEQQEEPDHLSP